VDFQVTYILPKDVPPTHEPDDRHFASPLKSQRSLNFIAALDIVLPFRSVPPSSPYTVRLFQ
jgi:hypothetical protein